MTQHPIEFELTIKLTVYGSTAGDALSAIETRLRHPDGPARDDRALVIRESHAKRVGAAK